ncbi:MAG: sodium/proton-translocating pyrophosphatase, partial [Dehalococcoidia bacterium]|nr:sodium/proton-translocating pyrophosphatase [Dehalococcoidia bacterium]
MDLVWLVPVTGIIAVLFAFWLARNVLSRDKGTPEMQAIADMIFEGSMAFLRRQYGTIAVLSLVVAAGVGVLVATVSEGVRTVVFAQGALNYGERVVSPTEEGILTAVAFLTGAAASGLSGYIGMYISVRSNLRVASAAQR